MATIKPTFARVLLTLLFLINLVISANIPLTQEFPHRKAINKFSKENISKLTSAWTSEFGAGSGILAPSTLKIHQAQAVCCTGYCLFIENRQTCCDNWWTSSDFDAAINHFKQTAVGKRGEKLCGSASTYDVYGDNTLLIKVRSWNDKSNQNCKGEAQSLRKNFGDTCAGKKGFTGPSCNSRS